MPFQKAIRHLRQFKREYQDRRPVEKLASLIRKNIVEQAPSSSGNLKRALLNAQFRYESLGPGNFSIRVTNRSRLGTDTDSAPRGTIAAFLDKYPQFRVKYRKTKKPQGRDIYGRYTRRVFERVPPAQAWWRLSAQAKAVLERERKRGRFGGESALAASRAPYFWVQSKKTGRALSSAAKAGLTRGSYNFVAVGIAKGKAEFSAYMRGRRGRP